MGEWKKLNHHSLGNHTPLSNSEFDVRFIKMNLIHSLISLSKRKFHINYEFSFSNSESKRRINVIYLKRLMVGMLIAWSLLIHFCSLIFDFMDFCGADLTSSLSLFFYVAFVWMWFDQILFGLRWLLDARWMMRL